MKWAIIVIFQSGIFETGLTYRSLGECAAAAEKLWLTESYEADEWNTPFNPFNNQYVAEGWLKCVPTK